MSFLLDLGLTALVLVIFSVMMHLITDGDE
jgi:hypothetical protein